MSILISNFKNIVRHDKRLLYFSVITRMNSKTLMEMRDYAKKVNPMTTKYLMQVKKSSNPKEKSSLWDVVMSYSKKNFNNEKSILLDPKYAEVLSKSIIQSTRGSPSNTIFIDLTAGVGLLYNSIQSHQAFKSFILSEPALSPLLETVIKSNASVNKNNLMLHKEMVAIMNNSDLFVPDPYWNSSVPCVTFFGIVSHQFIKRLIYNIISYKDSLETVKSVQDTIYKYGRPEFFFVVTQRTKLHLEAQVGRNQFRLLANTVFQFFFDFEVLTSVPRKAFLPWKSLPFSRSFPLLDSEFYLIKCRPMSKIRGSRSDFNYNLKHFMFFLKIILGKRTSKVYEVLDPFIPNVCQDMKYPETIMKKTGDLSNSEILSLFEGFVSHPSFENSIFVIGAENFSDTIGDHKFSQSIDEDKTYELQRKNLMTSGTLEWKFDNENNS